MRADPDIGAFCYGLGMGILAALAAVNVRQMALLGIGIAVFGLVWIVISHSRSGAEA